MPYQAVRTRPDEARDALTALWADNLPISPVGCAAKHRWFYLDGPGGMADAFLLSTNEGVDAGRPVGCAGIGRRTFVLRGRPFSAALLADLVVDRRHRSGFPALTLQRAVRRFAHDACDVTYGFPNRHAVALHLKLGYRELGKVVRWVRLIEHAPYVKRVVDRPVLTKAAGALLDDLTTARDAVFATPKRITRRLVWGPPIDARFDALWDEVATRDQITARRDAKFIRWRHADRPAPKAELATLVARGSGRLRAWAAIVEIEDRYEIADFLAATAEDLSALLALVVPALRARGGSSISLCYLGAPWVTDVLRARAFRPREAARTVIVDPGKSGALDPTELLDARRWYVTDADEDA